MIEVETQWFALAEYLKYTRENFGFLNNDPIVKEHIENLKRWEQMARAQYE
jgi:hypothetical protein